MKADSFREFVLDQLASLGDVACRAMFGGHGLYRGEAFFGILFKGRLYFRTDAASQGDFVAQGMKPFRPNPGTVLRSYFEVPAEVLERRERLCEWALRAIAIPPAKTGRR
jgi:DNA transformation protein